MSRPTCKLCRRAIRGREPASYCIQHKGIICEMCRERCEDYGHDLSEGKINQYGEFVKQGRPSRRGRNYGD